jgi:hypothetical protein
MQSLIPGPVVPVVDRGADGRREVGDIARVDRDGECRVLGIPVVGGVVRVEIVVGD